MKRFLGFVKKEFYHIFRDPRTMLILFGIPVAQVLIFGFVVNTEIKEVKIAVLDQSKDEVTKKITSKLLSSGYFLLNKNLKNHKDIQESFQKGEIKEVIIFEPNFSKKLERENNASVQLLADASDPNMASLIVNYTSAIIKEYTSNNININKNLISITPETRMFY